MSLYAILNNQWEIIKTTYISIKILPYKTNPKLFADDTSLFILINDPNATAKQLCENLNKIKERASNGK